MRNEISYTTATTTTGSTGATVENIWGPGSFGQGTNNSTIPSFNNNNNNNNSSSSRNNNSQNRNTQSSSSYGGGQNTRSAGFNASTEAAIQSTWKL